MLLLSLQAHADGRQAIEQAQELYNRSKYQQAISLLSNFISKTKSDDFLPYALYTRALAYYQMKEYNKAINDFVKISKDYKYMDELHADALMALAETYKKQRAFNLAIITYEEIEKKYPDKKEEAQTQKAWAYYLSGRTDNAKNILDKMIDSDGKLDSLEKIYVLASMYKDEKKYKEAVNTFKKIPKDSILANDVYYQIGDVAVIVERYDKAIEFFRNVEPRVAYFNRENNLKELAWYKMAIAYYNLDKFYEARIVCEDFLRKFPSSSLKKDVEQLILLTYLRQEKIDSLLGFYDTLSFKTAEKSNFDIDNMIGNYFFNQGQYAQALNFYSKLVDLNESNYRIKDLFNLANSYFFLEDYEQAQEYYKMILKEHPNDSVAPKAAFRLAYIFLQEQKYDSSLKLYSTIKKYFSKQDYIDAVTYNMGWCYYKLGENNKALKVYEEFIRKYPESQLLPNVLYETGNVYYSQGLFSQAADYYYQVIERFSDSKIAAEASYRLGRSYYYSGDLDDALEKWQELAQNAKNPQIAMAAKYEIAQAYFEQDNLERALLAVKEFAGSYPKNKLSYSLLDRVQEYVSLSENYEQGITYFNKLLTAYNKEADLRDNISASLARLYFLHQEKDMALKMIKSIKEESDNFKNFNPTASSLYDVCSVMIASNSYFEAEQLLQQKEKSIDFDDLRGVNLLIKGEISLAKNDYKQAEEYFKRLLEEHGDSSYTLFAYFNLAESYSHSDKFDKAAEIYRSIISSYKDERSLKAYYELGQIYYNQKRYNEALACAQHTIVFFPQSSIWAPKAYLMAVNCQKGLGNREKAANLLKRLITLYPQSKEAQEAQKMAVVN
jgi:tetratricopeptide (TPR) repeat protein